ncbi:MAG TPA: murein biosynthesis integral membrane protein MurJ [Elusimicrobia bacterium]|nr:MAG: murein biosynthesis integral membrane protein MurJ [Elusimicrobia bacterium RIFOXYD2_FULL_34_30]HAM39181.1 murein biosynthesis integral membrane protein MurJ [Elusimicrobiota bacterium]
MSSKNLKKESKIAKYIGYVSAGTMFSRILGYLRDMLVGWLFGAGMSADAFYAALRIPNLFRRLLGEGSLSASYVPVFTEYLSTKDKEDTNRLFNIILTVLVITLIFVTIIGIIFAPQLTKLIAYGFEKNPEKLQLTITLTRLMFPSLLLACLAAFLLATLNSLKSFFIPAISPSLLSIAEIAFIIGVSHLILREKQIIGLAIAVIVGGILQLLVMIPSVVKKGFSFKPVLNFNHPGLKQIFLLMIPAMWGISIDQVNAFVDTIFASFLKEGSITALYYSNRVMQLPLALFGIAVASVSLPLMSASVSKKNVDDMKNMLAFSIKISSLAIFPSLMGLIILGKPMIKLLFEHGKFDSIATSLTNSALFFYALGLPAFGYVKIFAGGFYSLKETKTPVKIASLCMIVNIVLNAILMGPLGVGGLALSSSISSWLNTILLLITLRRKIGGFGGRKILITLLKIISATFIMGLGCYILSNYVFKNLFINVFGTIIICFIIYLFMTRLLKISEMKSVMSVIKREEPTVDE